MLPTIATLSVPFTSASEGLDLLDRRTHQRFVLPLLDLRVDPTGRLSHAGSRRIEELAGLPMTDEALWHVQHLVGIPGRYARVIEPELHAHSVNELVARNVTAFVTVHVEDRHDDNHGLRVVAIQRGIRTTVRHEVALRRLLALGVSASGSLRGGTMDVRFGDDVAVEVLPGDTVRMRGSLRNERWGAEGAQRAAFEASVHLLRLICENGAFAWRQMGAAKMFSNATEQELSETIDRQIHRVLADSSGRLRSAVARMTDDIPDEAVLKEARLSIGCHASRTTANELLGPVVSAWELFNALTAAAHHAKTEAARRHLQIQGGELLDRYFAS